MSSNLSTTCLATLALIGKKPAVTVGFNYVAPLLERKYSQGTRRVRVRLLSSSSNEPEDTRRRVVPPPKRWSRADIDESSVDQALSKLNLSGGSSGRSHRQQQQLQQQKRKTSPSLPGDKSKSSLSRPRNPQVQVPADLHRHVAERNVLGAVSNLELVTGDERTGGVRTSGDEAALRAAFSAVLNECGRAGLWREAKQVVTVHMPTAAVEPSGTDWLLAIDACAGPGGAGQAILYLHDMREKGLEVNRSVYAAVVHACARNKEAARTLFLVKDAAKRGTPLLPSDVTIAMRELMAGPAGAAGWSQALALHDAFFALAADMLIQEADESEACGDALGPAADSAGDGLSVSPLMQTPRRLQVLSEVAPGWEEVCEAGLEACRRGRKWKRALHAMKACAAGQDAWSALALRLLICLFSMVVADTSKACSGAGEWRAALSILEGLLAEGLLPGGEAYEAAMAACARGGVVDLAFELLERALVEHPVEDRHWTSSSREGDHSEKGP